MFKIMKINDQFEYLQFFIVSRLFSSTKKKTYKIETVTKDDFFNAFKTPFSIFCFVFFTHLSEFYFTPNFNQKSTSDRQ